MSHNIIDLNHNTNNMTSTENGNESFIYNTENTNNWVGTYEHKSDSLLQMTLYEDNTFVLLEFIEGQEPSEHSGTFERSPTYDKIYISNAQGEEISYRIGTNYIYQEQGDPALDYDDMFIEGHKMKKI